MSVSELILKTSPWASVWLKPRRTIEAILAERPRRGVLLLGTVSLMANTVSELLGFAIEWRLSDWRISQIG